MKDFGKFENRDLHHYLRETDWEKGRIFQQITQQTPTQEHLRVGSHKRFLLEIIKLDSLTGAISNISHRLMRKGVQQRVASHPQINILWKTNQSVEVFISEKNLEIIRIIGNEGINLQAFQMPLLLDTSSRIRVKFKDRLFYLRLVAAVHFDDQDRFSNSTWKPILLLTIAVPILVLFFRSLPHVQPPELQPDLPKRVARIELNEVQPQQVPPVVEKKASLPQRPKSRIEKSKRSVAQQHQPSTSTAHVNVKDLGILGSIMRHPGSSAQEFNPGSVIETNQSTKDAHVAKLLMAAPPKNQFKNKNRGESEEALNTISTRLASDKTFADKTGGLSVGNAKKSNLEFGNDPHSIFGDTSHSTLGSMVGGLSRASVLGAMTKFRNKIRTCYEDALSSNSKVGGKITYRWDISPEGDVISVQTLKSQANYPSLEDCISGVIKSISFPKAKNGQPTTVIYPFVFKKA